MRERILKVLAEINEEVVEDLDRDLLATGILDSFELVNMVVELEEASDLHYINIRIVDEKTKEEVYWIDHVYRAWDFQWIT